LVAAKWLHLAHVLLIEIVTNVLVVQNAVGVLVLQHVLMLVVEILLHLIVLLDALALFTEFVQLALILMVVNGAKIFKLANQKEPMELHVQLHLVVVMDIAIFKEMEAVLLVIASLVVVGALKLKNVLIHKLLVAILLKIVKHVINIVIVIHVWMIQLANGVMIPDLVQARNTDLNVTCLHINAPIIAC